mmetsp:Transcript_26959/g.29395  ORF Transcript_26959/g.29395 Transcript_26959/m.29395 type:complete len:89 (-) Transcript_26959:319-585(-)
MNSNIFILSCVFVLFFEIGYFCGILIFLISSCLYNIVKDSDQRMFVDSHVSRIAKRPSLVLLLNEMFLCCFLKGKRSMQKTICGEGRW